MEEENSGNLREALRAAEEAWRRIQGMPEYPLLAPSVLSQLAVLYARIGRSQRALWFLERGLSITEGIEKLKTRLRRASVLVALGRHEEARLDLESLELTAGPAAARDYLLREISLNLGEFRQAIQYYPRVANIATHHGFNYEEFLSRLALVSILGSRGEFAAAHEHITRAQELISDKADRLSFRFREVLLMLWQGRYTQSHAAEEFTGLIQAF